jgi:hypothetical protein
MSKPIHQETVFHATPSRIYGVLLDSKTFSQFSGGMAARSLPMRVERSRVSADEQGYLPAEAWPRVYSAIATAGPIATPTVEAAEKVGNSMVAGARFVNYRLSLAA